MAYITHETSRALRLWLKDNHFCVRCAVGNQFCYDYDDNYIYLSRNYNYKCDEDFNTLMKELGITKMFHNITLSFLHELGHSETMWQYDEEDFNKYFNSLKCIKVFITDKHKLNFAYWNLPIEKSANLWLVNYVNHNLDKVEELNNLILQTIIECK